MQWFSAGITYAVSRACKQGLLKSCTCSRTASTEEFTTRLVMGRVSRLNILKYFIYQIFAYWNSCGDNIDYGYRFGRDFVDTPEKEIDAAIPYNSLMNTNQTVNGGRRRKFFQRGKIRRQMNIHNNEVGRRVRLKIRIF